MKEFPPLVLICLHLEGIESSEEEKDDSNTEQRPLLNEMKTSFENTSQIRCEMEKNLTGKGMKG